MYGWFSRTSDLKVQLIALVLGIIAVSVVFVVWMFVGGLSNSDWWKTLGYPGVFFLSLLASGGMVFPIPSLAATCGAAGLDLNLIVVGILAGLGETLGELVGYSIGFGGQSVVQRRNIYKRAKAWMVRWGVGVLLILSIIPNPIFDFVGIAAGALRYPIKRFLIIVWVGKTLKGLIIAHACFWIVEWIRWLA
jgi:membrane protein YqaA with SNARE-associated domain